MGAVASVCQPSTLRMLIWPEASNAQNSIATYHQCGRAAASGGSRRRRFCHRPTPPPASPSGDTPLNRLIGNELQRTSSVVLGIGFDNTPEERKSTRLNSSHRVISYAVFCLKKKKKTKSKYNNK